MGALLGAGLVAIVDGVLSLWLPEGESMPRENITIAAVGALSLAGLAWLLALVAGLFTRGRLLSRPGAGFWIGVAIGLPPLTATLLVEFQWVLSLGGWGTLLFWAAVAVPSIVLSILALPLGRLGCPSWKLALPVVGALVILIGISPFMPISLAQDDPVYYSGITDDRPQATGPDVILVSVDTLRADAIVGEDSAPVPNLDRMRSEGLWASYGLSGSNQTLPGHVAMLTGRDAMEHGVRSNLNIPSGELVLLSERFQERGWATAGIVTNSLVGGYLGFDRGYDCYDDRLVRWKTKADLIINLIDRHTWIGWFMGPYQLRKFMHISIMAQLRKRKRVPLGKLVMERVAPQIDLLTAEDRPYFYFIHFMDPHAPYGPPQHLKGTLSKEGKENLASEYLPPGDDFIDGGYILKVEHELAQGTENAKSAAEYYQQVYLEEVAFIDECMGGILEKVEESGRPTIILFTADHGEHFGEHNLMEHANSLYEENIRVPFVLWGSGVPKGEMENIPHLADVAPTLLELCGLWRGDLTGRAIHRELEPAPHASTDQTRVAVRMGPWKLIAERSPESDDEPEPIALFHIDNDPFELDNLLGKVEIPPDLKREYENFLANDQYRPLITSDPEQLAALMQLGYAEDLNMSEGQGDIVQEDPEKIELRRSLRKRIRILYSENGDPAEIEALEKELQDSMR